MQKKTKKAIAVTISIAMVVGLFIGGRYLLDVMSYRRIVSEIEIFSPDLQQVPDGVFNGSFDAILVSADVEVVVEDHQIVAITINEHHHGREHALAAEVIINEVISRQTLEVDTVSEATNSSYVILSAIEDALEQAIE